ncbi:MAG: hypothetical protein ABSC42_12475 [Tepidisphaeraceae bacterium]|jgi:hypothetical protein
MGYELHITRKVNWSDEDGPAIALSEWQKLVDGDADLSWYSQVGAEDSGKVASWKNDQGTLRWDEGQIVSKNPEEALIIKMVALAAKLGATAQGDDGEIYRPDGSSFEPTPPTPPAPSLIDQIRQWFRRRKTRRNLEATLPRFTVGKRVRDAWGFRGTLIEVSTAGLGCLVVKYDDGRQQSFAYIASGLELDEGTSTVADAKRSG